MIEPKNTIKLDSPRLFILPLTFDQILLYTKPDDSLEVELGVAPYQRELPEELMMTIQKFVIPYVVGNPNYLLYGTLWVIVHKVKNVIVGDIGFKGAPSDKGLVEIGYGTHPHFFNNGFMTEALGVMTGWAFSQPEVSIILAETDKSNLPSQKVLNKNNFQPFAETETMYWWRLDKQIE